MSGTIRTFPRLANTCHMIEIHGYDPDARSIEPFMSPRLVAKAWLDPEFKRLALEDGLKASLEMGIDWLPPAGWGAPSEYPAFHVLEDTPKVKNVVVCALRSFYPRPIFGAQPEGCCSPNYRRRIIRWPRQVLAEFGLQIPEDVEIRVVDSNQNCRYMVMPMRPPGTEGWNEDQLARIVTRDCLIGVALPHPDRKEDVRTSVHLAAHAVGH